MADIDVQRGGPTIWPWIMGLLVLALLIWLLAERFATDSGPASGEPATDTLMIDPGA